MYDERAYMNETGRKTFFWYRVYCAVLALLYLGCIGAGIILALIEIPPSATTSPEEKLFISIILSVIGAIMFVISAVALILPAKPFNWIVGLIMIAIGMTSCAFLPFMIPLMIYWVKPETKAYFGRN